MSKKSYICTLEGKKSYERLMCCYCGYSQIKRIIHEHDLILDLLCCLFHTTVLLAKILVLRRN